MKSYLIVVMFFVAAACHGNARAATATCKQCLADANEVLSQMDAAKATAAKLVSAAEAHCKGQAVGYVFELVKGVWDGKVYCVAEGKVQTVFIDATGTVTKMEEAKDMDDLVDVAKAMTKEKVTLAKVIEAADRRSRGKTLAVIAAADDESASFDCYCGSAEKLVQVFVDGLGKAGKAGDAEALPGTGHSFHEKKPKPKPAG